MLEIAVKPLQPVNAAPDKPLIISSFNKVSEIFIPVLPRLSLNSRPSTNTVDTSEIRTRERIVPKLRESLRGGEPCGIFRCA